MRVVLAFSFIMLCISNYAQTYTWTPANSYYTTDASTTFSGGTNNGSFTARYRVTSCSWEGGITCFNSGDGPISQEVMDYSFTFYDALGNVIPGIFFSGSGYNIVTACGSWEEEDITWSWTGGASAITYVKQEYYLNNYARNENNGMGVGHCDWEVSPGFSSTVYPLGDPTTLPIELVGFEAAKKANMVELTWQTASETNSNYYEIQRSNDVKTWETLGTIKINGNSTSKKEYKYIDERPLREIAYYRLKTVDLDDSYEYSPIVSAEGCFKEKKLGYYPNPAADEVYIILPHESEALMITLFDVVGSELSIDYEKVHNNKWHLHTNDLPKGIYFIDAVTPSGFKYTGTTFMKN